MRKWLEITAYIVFTYAIVACAVYAFRHNTLTSTQLILRTLDALTWQ